ncbi:MAG TPA: hypothetical protein VFE90_15550 [Myxococcales bacterium]|jgi:hypothetical protein|nr:hypothetical protein [Myxococcales bacterium]
MTDLRVPKRRVPVEIVQVGGAVRRIAVFLAEAVASHAGPERLADILNGQDEFIPAFDEQAAAMTFLNRAAVALARMTGQVEVDGANDVTVSSEHDVEITLLDGSRLRGLISYSLPSDRSRLVDFLNDATPFFQLVEGDSVTLVSRRQVARVAVVQG